MTCSLDFVDSIDAAPTVRLNLSDSVTWILNANETDFSPPPLRQAVAQTMLADGGVVPSSAYDFRRITLGLFLAEETPDDMAAALQSLYRELDRPGGNILRWHDHTTHPVFFRTFRASASSVRQLGRDGRRKKIEVELRAEPFGYGLREDPVVDATVSADPAAVSNGCFVDVTGVKGDVETPALIKWPEDPVQDRQSLFAIRRRGTPSQAPFVFQVENMGQNSDTTVQANDPVFSGAGSNYSRCTFAVNTIMTLRANITDLGTAATDLRGTYRAFLRYRKNTAADSINIRIRWGTQQFSDFITNISFPTPDTTDILMADLGLVTMPYGSDPVHDFRTGVEVAVDDTFFIGVDAERSSGSGTLDLDCLLFVPADDRLAMIGWPPSTGFSVADHFWLDAHDNSVHARNASDQVASIGAPEGPIGGLPMLSSNQTNRLFMLYEIGSDNAHDIATNTTVSVAYLPRYLTVRPAST